MNRYFSILLFLSGSALIGQAQEPCRNCPPDDPPIERRIVQTPPDKWPKRPDVTTVRPPQYTRFKALLEITNISDKKIKQVTWSCTLVELVTKRTLASRIFITRKTINPHKEAILTGTLMVDRNVLHGPKVVSSTQPTMPHDPNNFPVFQINNILEIKFADGSVEKTSEPRPSTP